MKAKELVGAVKKSLNGDDNKKGGSVLTQKDVSKVIKARVDNIMKAIEDIAIKAANTTAVNSAVQEIDKSLTNFANSMDSKSFKGLWGRFFKFKWNVKRLVRMTNSLQKISKDAEPGVKAIATISFIAQSLSEVCENIGKVKVPTGSTRKVKRMVKVINGLRVIIEDVNVMGPLLKKSKNEFKLLKESIKDLKDIFDAIKDIKVGLFVQLKLKMLMGTLRLVQRVIRKIANMKRVGAAARKMILIKSFFISLSLLMLTIILVAPIFLIVPLAMLAILLGVWLFSMMMKLITKLLRKIALRSVYAMLLIAIIVLCLVVVVMMLMLIAQMAQPIVESSIWILGLMLVLIIFVVLLAVLGTILNSISTVMAAAIAGLVIMIIVIALLLVVVAMVYEMTMMAKAIFDNIGVLTGAVFGLIPIILAAIAVGAAGWGAMFALPGMGMALGLMSMVFLIFLQLKTIQSVNLDIKKIKSNISKVKSAVSMVESAFNTTFSFRKMMRQAAAAGQLRRVSRIVRQIEKIVRQLNRIQKFKLKKAAIKKNIDNVWKVVDQIEAEISGRIDPSLVSGPFWKRWKAQAAARRRQNQFNNMLRRVNRILGTVHRIIEQLNKIQEFKLKDKAIENNLDSVFKVVDKIEERLNANETLPPNFDFKDVVDFFKKKTAEALARKAGANKIKRTEMILAKLLNITETLKSIQDIKLDEKTVLEKIEMLYRFVDLIEEKINQAEKLPDDWDFKDLISNWKERVAENLQAKAAEGRLGKSEAILLKLSGMATALKTIQDIKIDKAKTMSKVTELFATGNEIFDFVMNGSAMDAKEAELIKLWYEQNRAGKKTKDTQKQLDSLRDEQNWMVERTTEHMNKVDGILNLVTGMADKFKSVVELKITPEKVSEKVRSIFSAVDTLVEILNNNQYADLSTDEFTDKYTTFLDVITNINDSMSDMAKVSATDVNNQKKLLANYGDFLTKVNAVDIEKVKTTADMFGQMARFSESVSGDFDNIAKSINENLMPVLEELKKVMQEMDKTLEQGFANTSASIGAAGGSANASEMSAQVARENPNASKDDVAAMARERLKKQDRDKAQGVSAKLDELIRLLKGQSGTVKVKTSMW